MSMRDLAERALEAAMRNGVTYADVRVEEARERHITTKNAKPGNVATYDSMGVGIRVIAGGCWGFAATDEISPKGLERAANLAIEIARSGAAAKKKDVMLAPEEAYESVWMSPCQIDPFSVPVDQNLQYLISVDRSLWRRKGITLAESSFVCSHKRQYFASSHWQPYRSDPDNDRRGIYRV